MAKIDWITPFLQVDPCLQEHLCNWTKVLQHSMSRHNMTNPDKPKFITVKYAILRFSKCKILIGKTLTIQHVFVKILQTFQRQSFALYGN